MISKMARAIALSVVLGATPAVAENSTELLPFGCFGQVFTGGVANSMNYPRFLSTQGYTVGLMMLINRDFKPMMDSPFVKERPDTVPFNFFLGVEYAYKPMITTLSYGSALNKETKDAKLLQLFIGSRSSFFWISKALSNLYMEGGGLPGIQGRWMDQHG